MTNNKNKTIRVRDEIHKKAKLSACHRMIPLQRWIEHLIEREYRDLGLDKFSYVSKDS